MWRYLEKILLHFHLDFHETKFFDIKHHLHGDKWSVKLWVSKFRYVSFILQIVPRTIYNFYVPQPRELVFPLQLGVKQCCIFRYRGIQCRNWTAHAHYSLTAERNLFLFLTSCSYSVSTDYYTRPIKSKWPGLVANLRPLRTTSAANNYNEY